VAGEQDAGARDDLDAPGAEAVAHPHVRPDQPRWDRVGVPLEGNEGRGTHQVGGLDGGRVTRGGKGPEPLELGQVAHRRTPVTPGQKERRGGVLAHDVLELGDRPGPAIADVLAEPVQLLLALGHGLGCHRPPETLGGEVDGLLHRSFSIPPSGRTRHHLSAIVLGHGDEARLDRARLRVDHGGHAVHPPAPGIAAQAAQHAVHGLDEMGLVLGLGEHAAELSRARKRPEQQMGVVVPGGFGQLVPVPLDLGTRRVFDLDGGASFHPGTGLAVRPQLSGSEPPSEALVGELEPEGHGLVVKGRRPHVGVLAQTFTQVRHELIELVGLSAFALAGDMGAVQVVPDRSPVPIQMTGDGRDRPALLA